MAKHKVPHIVLPKDFDKPRDPFPHYDMARLESLRRLSLEQWAKDSDRFIQKINSKHRGHE